MLRFRKCSDYVPAAQFTVLAAWSAYAVVEFVFSSILFRAHPALLHLHGLALESDGLLLVGFLVTGLVLGALAGLLSGVCGTRKPCETIRLARWNWPPP